MIITFIKNAFKKDYKNVYPAIADAAVKGAWLHQLSSLSSQSSSYSVVRPRRERPYPSSTWSFKLLIDVANIVGKSKDLTDNATWSSACATSRLATVSACASVAKFALSCVPIGVMGHESVAAGPMRYRASVYMTWMAPIVLDASWPRPEFDHSLI